jgi:hypothetical protein
MEIIKKNLVALLIVLVLLVAVLIRSTGINHFKSDAKSHAEASMLQTNTISKEKLGSLEGDKLVVNLDGDHPKEMITIPADSILMKNHLNKILKHNGPVVIYSTEPAKSARIWMVLSQMGRKNFYILTDNPGNETLNYKFLPDSLSTE